MYQNSYSYHCAIKKIVSWILCFDSMCYWIVTHILHCYLTGTGTGAIIHTIAPAMQILTIVGTEILTHLIKLKIKLQQKKVNRHGVLMLWDELLILCHDTKQISKPNFSLATPLLLWILKWWWRCMHVKVELLLQIQSKMRVKLTMGPVSSTWNVKPIV